MVKRRGLAPRVFLGKMKMTDPTNNAANDSQPTADTARHMARVGSRVWFFVKTLLIAYLLIVVVAMFLENSLLYFPSVYPSGNWQPAGLKFEDAWFSSADGTSLHGWYVPCQNAKAAVLFLPRQRRQSGTPGGSAQGVARSRRRFNAHCRLSRLRPQPGPPQ